MSYENVEDREILAGMPMERLLDLFFLHIRNLWRVDGLYFLGIEERFGTEAATEIDAKCWKTMAKIEAKSLKELFKVKEVADLATLMRLLRNTSWALDQANKEVEVTAEKAVFKVTKCRTQETRIGKGLDVFPCKTVRFGYLKNFAEELNPKIKTICRVCPPDKRQPNAWCEWEFILR